MNYLNSYDDGKSVCDFVALGSAVSGNFEASDLQLPLSIDKAAVAVVVITTATGIEAIAIIAEIEMWPYAVGQYSLFVIVVELFDYYFFGYLDQLI